ncbi:MAG: NapC/NirT family cytochrome c [Rhodospirillales bacterium]|nr:NapC/NirT family cytochrome c [Rhodospirillales bacterium]
MELAQTVWAELEANDSKPCRQCHSFDAMDIHKQSEDARDAMEVARESEMSCIECHKGIAHKLPEGY